MSDDDENSRVRGRAFYYDGETKETTWDEPKEFLELAMEIDRNVIRGIDSKEHERVLRATRRLMHPHTSAECRTWIQARDLLWQILKNVVERPNEEKFRTLRKKPDGQFVAKVWSQRYPREVLIVCGFRESADAVHFLERDTKSLNASRVALSRLQIAVDARDEHNDRKKQSSNNTWENTKCSHCNGEIESGARRLWTTDPTAPKGEYSYKCSACENYVLCERCWDAKTSGVKVIHEIRGHTFEHVAPVETRHNTRIFGRGPWGNFAGASVGRARERLRERTGL